MEDEASERPSVSLITVNYNTKNVLIDCVRLALETVDQLIVVDNASVDDSIESLQSVFGKEPRVEVVRNERNLGFAAACNIGMAKANGEYLLFLNPDCYLSKGAVDALASILRANPDAGMAGGLLINPDGSEQGGARRAVPTPWRSLVRACGLSRLGGRWPRLFFDFHLHKQPLPERPIEIEAISGACMMVKRDAIKQVGGWDESYFLHCEDLDWCMRFRQAGWKIMFVPNARVLHLKGACSKSRPIFVEWHKHRGMVHFYRKFFQHQYPWGLMWLVTLGVWLRFAGLAGYRTFVRMFCNEAEAAPAEVNSRSVMAKEVMPKNGMAAKMNAVHVGVIGASSMVGTALLPMLAESGKHVHAFSRRLRSENQQGVTWHQLEVEKIGGGHMKLPTIEQWVCLAPIKVLMEQLDFVEACGVKRVVALSSTSRFTKVSSSDPAELALVKHLVESEAHLAQWAESRGIEWVLLRPTLVYGYGLDRNVSLIAQFVRRFGFFPTLGEAKGLRQPVFAGDVAFACLAALQRPEAVNHAYNISGAERLSYRAMVVRIFAALGRKPHFVMIPLWVFFIAMNMLKIFPRFRKLSPAMAERMNQDMVFGYEEAARDLGFAPRPFNLDQTDLPA